MPKFNFTTEQRQEFKPYQKTVDSSGIMQHGSFKDKHISEVPQAYLQKLVNAAVSDAIAAQQELNNRSAEMLDSLVESYPELEDVFVSYWEANYQTT
jgi:uncharacterized damage-inducible protein DinB